MSTVAEDAMGGAQSTGELLGEQTWAGKIFSDGWVDAPSTVDVTEPATGNVLGTAGVGDSASLARAAASAARAQQEWAAVPFTDRAAVIRRAADLLERHQGELVRWIVRETGSVRDKGSRPSAG